MIKKLLYIVTCTSLLFLFATDKVQAENTVDAGSIQFNNDRYVAGAYYFANHTFSGSYYIRDYANPPLARCRLIIQFGIDGEGVVQMAERDFDGTVEGADFKCTFNEDLEAIFTINSATYATFTGSGIGLGGSPVVVPVFLGTVRVDQAPPTSHIATATANPDSTTIRLTALFSDQYPETPAFIDYYYRWNDGDWSLGGTWYADQVFDLIVPFNTGHYDLYSVGIDKVGNRETKAATVEATASMDAPPPTTATPTPTATVTTTRTPTPSLTPTTSLVPVTTVVVLTSPPVTGLDWQPVTTDDTDNNASLILNPIDNTKSSGNAGSVLLLILAALVITLIGAGGGLFWYLKKHRNTLKHPADLKTAAAGK